MTQPLVTIGRFIKYHRESHGWNQKELAEKVDVSPATISGTENERFIPSPEILYRLAQTLQVPFHELVERLPIPKTDTLLEIISIYCYGLEFERASNLIATLKADDTLLDYQRNQLILQEGTLLIIQQDTRLQGVEMLNALAQNAGASAQFDHLFAAKVQSAIGNAWFRNREIVTAKHHYQKALDTLHSRPLVQDKFVPALYFNIANCLQTFNQDEAAIVYLKKAITLFETYQISYYLGACYYTLGICYQHLEDRENSALNYRKAIPYYEEVGNRRFAVRSRSYSYVHGNEPADTTLQVLEEELVLLQDELNDNQKAATLSRIALVYLNQHDLPRAKVVLERAEQLINTTEANEERGYYLFIKAKYLLEAGDYEAASTYAIDASDVYASIRYYNNFLKDAVSIARVALLRLRKSLDDSLP